MSKEEEHSEDIGIEAQIKLKSLTCRQDSDDGDIMGSSDGSECTEMVRQPSSKLFSSDHLRLNIAASLAARGRAAEAIDTLEPYILNNPNDIEALHLRATCLATTGNKGQALASFAGALAVDSNHVPSLIGCAGLYKDSGLLEDSLSYLQRAQESIDANEDKLISDSLRRQLSEAYAVILTDLGTQYKLAGKPGWKEYYNKAMDYCPVYPAIHYNLGVAASEQGDHDIAMTHYQRAVELEPRYPEAWCNMGAIYKTQGHLDDAIAAYERALEAAPNLDIIKLNLVMALTEQGTLLKTSGNADAGIKLYERALALNPKHAETLYNLGVAYAEQGWIDKAIFMYETTITIAPDCAEAHNNLGVLYKEQGNMERAIQCYEHALSARPTFPQALNNMAVMYTQQGKAHQALNLLRAAILSQPTYAEAYNNLGVLQRDVGDVHAAIESYERCCDFDVDNRNASQNRLLALNYVYHGESQFVCKAHAAWGRKFQSLHPRLPPIHPHDRIHHSSGSSNGTAIDDDDNNNDNIDNTITTSTTTTNNNTTNTTNLSTTTRTRTKQPLRVGYLSPDLFVHSVSYFAEAPLTHHNTHRIHHTVYSVCPRPDEKTDRLRRAVHAAGGTWKDVAHLSEHDLSLLIRKDEIDILVELTGHTAHNRLGVVARRPAPIQVTWIGYPNSTGLTAVDYRLTDSICDPVDTQQTFVEELIRLPGCFLCYTPSHNAPPVAPLPALTNNFITFGSFNALAKQTPDVLRVWAKILHAVPCSRLILKNKPFACPTVQQQYWMFFEEQGISKERIDLLPLAPTTAGHLSQYAYMDVCLDPWPYAGTTTTAEALYMGVPCLTLAGSCHAHNVGASLLTAVGLQDDWVAVSVDDYINKARILTQDVDRLSLLREGLRERMLSSRLCDAKGFVKNVEDVYYDMYQRWLDDSISGENDNRSDNSDDDNRSDDE